MVAISVTVATSQTGDTFAGDAFHACFILGELGLYFAEVLFVLTSYFPVFVLQRV